MKEKVNWDTVGFLLQEAVEQLELYVAELQFAQTCEVPRRFRKRLMGWPITEAYLESTLAETYLRLNFAWNNRHSDPKEMD